MDYTTPFIGLLFMLLGLALAIAWTFFPFLLFDRLAKQRKILEDIRDNTQASAHCDQKADRRAEESMSPVD